MTYELPTTPGLISTDLRELTAEINAIDPELVSHGVLGGEYGYGAEFSNDVFEMHPFWWGECECGHESREWDWVESHEHGNDCYQKVIRRRGFIGFEDDRFDQVPYDTRREVNEKITRQVCAEMELDPDFGSYIHCTCTYRPDWERWAAENPHPKTCPAVRPNFTHKASGVEISWYKYIGRGMEVPEDLTRKQWRSIFSECLESIGES